MTTRRVAGVILLGWTVTAAAGLAQLRPAGTTRWSRETTGILGTGGAGDRFGAVLARGDFDGDGFEDLAIGVPEDAVAAVSAAGSVSVLYGSRSGIAVTGNQLWSLDTVGLGLVPEANERFGAALAAGDFDDDGFADLAIGVPGRRIGSDNGAGIVIVLRGSAGRLTASGAEVWSQVELIGFDPDPSDACGSALVVGDFNGDEVDDLAIGSPFESLPGAAGAGVAHVVYGAAGVGLDVLEQDVLWQGSASGAVPGTAGLADGCGMALGVGDFDASGHDDLAIGCPGETVDADGVTLGGAVLVVYGTAAGLDPAGPPVARLINENDLVVGGADATALDQFGAVLASTDVFGGGADDLVVGVPLDDRDGLTDVGTIYINLGAAGTGLGATSNTTVRRTAAANGRPEANGDRYGASLAVAEVQRNWPADPRDDLAIGIPGRDGLFADTGAVLLLVNQPSLLFSAADLVGAGAALPAEELGGGLVFGDWNGDGTPDLAMGAPGEAEFLAGPQIGAVHVVPGYLFADGFQSGNVGGWSSATP